MDIKLALLAIGSSLLLFGCVVEHPRGYARGPEVVAAYSYVYYPDAEVYYDSHRHVYFWAEGSAWRSGPRMPANIVLRSHVTVRLDSPEPYRHHDEVRAKYPRQKQEGQRERTRQDHDGR